MHLPSSHPNRKIINTAFCRLIHGTQSISWYDLHLTFLLTLISTQLNQNKVHTPAESSPSQPAILCLLTSLWSRVPGIQPSFLAESLCVPHPHSLHCYRECWQPSLLKNKSGNHKKKVRN